ncbi:MAG: hypothetical protein IKJ30_04375 [Bacilli bacterium]|nr:hypothetical protein [Bacilli bacterium]
MFNRKKANDYKYCEKKIRKDVSNIRYIGPVAADELFNKRDYREWSLDFADIVYKSPELIAEIDALPMETKKIIAWNLVTWHGDLITKFGEEIRNDPDVCRAAVGPDHIEEMPTKLIERVVSRDGDTAMVSVVDYSNLKTWYELFPELGEKAREGIIKGSQIYIRPEDERYITENVPESLKDNEELVKQIISRVPYIYPALSDRLKKDVEILRVIVDTPYEKDAREIIASLPEKEKKELASLYRVGWYGAKLPEALNYIFKDKEYMKILLENNKFDRRVLEAVDKELLKDPEFATYCLRHLETGYGNDEKLFVEAFPEDTFKKGENVALFIKGMSYRYKENEVARDLVNGLSPKEFEKAARVHPYIVGVSTTQDASKVIRELVKDVKEEDVVQLMHAVGGFDKFDEEMKKAMLIKAPETFYKYVSDRDREFFVEIAQKNPAIIECIKDPQLRSDVLIEYTTIKYLDKKAMKITSEEELDALIEKVKGIKKTATRTTKAKANETPKKEAKTKNTKK